MSSEEQVIKWVEKSAAPTRRNWLVFGSAPQPTVPKTLAAGYGLLCINNSGLTAHRLELGPADLTIRAEHKSWDEIEGLSSRALLWISNKNALALRLKYPRSFRHKVQSLRAVGLKQRDSLIESTLGIVLEAERGELRPSNGIFGIVLAIASGATRIIVCGFSLSESGHSYNDRGEPRRQIEPDLKAFKLMASKFPQVECSERALAETTGLRLAD